MTRYIQCRPEALAGLVRRDLDRLEQRIHRAIFSTAREGAKVVRARAPKAFGELRESVQAFERGSHGEPSIAVDAPHAAAVEIGTPPHTPNIEKLTEWVRLRGMQSLNFSDRQLARMGPTTLAAARGVGAMLRREVQDGPGGQYSPIDAPTKVAMAIAKAIEKHGTRPHWYVRDSLPDIASILSRRVYAAVHR